MHPPASHPHRVLFSMLPLSLQPSILIFFFQDTYSVIWNSNSIHQSTFSSTKFSFLFSKIILFQDHFCLAIQVIDLNIENFSYKIPVGASLHLEKETQFLWEYLFFLMSFAATSCFIRSCPKNITIVKLLNYRKGQETITLQHISHSPVYSKTYSCAKQYHENCCLCALRQVHTPNNIKH